MAQIGETELDVRTLARALWRRAWLLLLLTVAVAAGTYLGLGFVQPIYTADTRILSAGDQLRIVVYDQPSLTNLYEVDQSGDITMPLIGNVPASDSTTDALADRIEAKLATAYLRDPDVSVEVATYRPFFVLGEVGNPGQFPYVPGITVESAIAVAGSFTERANRRVVRVSRTVHGQLLETLIPVTEPIRPGDTIYVLESLF